MGVVKTGQIAVMVLNWNGRVWLRPCLDALLRQSGVAFDPWLIDNGSRDGSLDLVREQFPDVRTYGIADNLGFGAAYNRAIAAIRSPWIALLNNDTVVQPGWLAALAGELSEHPEAAAVGSKLLYLDRPEVVNHAGGRLTTLGAAYDVGLGQLDGPGFDKPDITGCATGAAMLIRRDAFWAVGGFDDRYFAYFDDADLCWRWWLAGYSVRYQPAARVLHAYGGSTGAGRASQFRVQLCQTNRLQNMIKHLEPTTLAGAFPLSLGYDMMRLVAAAHASDQGTVRAISRGTAAFARIFPHAWNARRRLQPLRQRSDRQLFDLGVLAHAHVAATEWRRLTRLS